MPAKRDSVSWMQKLAQEKRKQTVQELEYYALVCAKWIKASIYDHNKLDNLNYLYPPDLEEVFHALNQEMFKGSFTEDDFWCAQKKTIHALYGDPNIMAQSSGQKVHALPYWNPTKHTLNIAPMGIVKSVDIKTREAAIYETVAPGELIMVPTSYTVGGKYSTLQGVAPQLKPLPRQIDEELDLAPITYAEWCTFINCPLSSCCKRQATWYDKGNRLVCSKCGETTKGTVF